ncbi:MAG TPA: hypothetical protein VKP58_11520 [Candidatus Acidoferrum sp.]|nr:hypothetical protein [Candidatus Acidoferrum sp.]
MALIGLVNLAERLFNQTQGNSNQDGALTSKSSKANAAPDAPQNSSDEFRPSSGNAANEAGLFQVSQAAVFTAAATVLLVQNGNAAPAPPENNTAASNPTTTTVETAAPVTATANSPANGPSNTTPAATAVVPATPAVTGPGAPASGVTTGATQIQSQLQNLNATLTALGLSADEIAAVDRVAQLIKDFSPAAFTSLINQLNVLAQDTAQPASPTATNTAAATGGTSGATAGTAQTGGFSIQELSIKFAGVNETLQPTGNTGNGGTIQISAFQIQVSEVTLTLNNGTTGQTAQITAPPPAAGSTTTAATPLTKTATA